MMQPEPMRARSRTWAWFQMLEPRPMIASGETSAVGWMRTSARSAMGSPWGAPILVGTPTRVRCVGQARCARYPWLKSRTMSSRSADATSKAGRTKAVRVRAFESSSTACTVPTSRPPGKRLASLPSERPAVTMVSPSSTTSVTGMLVMTSWPPGCPRTSPRARLAWSSATTVERVSTTKRVRAVSSVALSTVPASAPAPSALATTGMPGRTPSSVPASTPTSQAKFDGSRLMIRTGRSSISRASVIPSSSRSSWFSRAASVSSAIRCSAPAMPARSSEFSPRRRSISPIAPKSPATPEPTPEIASRTGSSARVVTCWRVTAGPVELASSISRLAIVNAASHRPARLRRCGLDGPYMAALSPGRSTWSRSTRSARELLAHKDALELVEVLEDAPGAAHDAGERIVGDVHRHLGRLGDASVEPAEQRATAGEDNPLVHDVGHELRWRLLDRLLDGLDDLHDRGLQRLADLVLADLDAAGQAGEEVAATEGGGALLPLRRVRRSDRDLDVLGGPLPHQQVVLPPREADDVGVHLVATDADAPRHDDPTQADDRDLGGAAADVHDQAARRLADRKPGTDRRGHRLLDQARPSGSGVDGGVAHSTLLHLRHAGRDADQDTRTRDAGVSVMHLVD